MQALAAHEYGVTSEEFERVLETIPLVDSQVRGNALARFADGGISSISATATSHRPRRHRDTEDVDA